MSVIFVCYNSHMKKLVLYGDSLFARVRKPGILMFEVTMPGYDVYNCANGGWDSSDCLKKAPYIAKLEPDVLVISLGANDAAPWKLVPKETFIRNIPEIFAHFPKSKIIYFLPPPINDVKVKNSGKNLTNQDIKNYHDAAKKVCEDNNVAYINSFEIFKPLLDAGQDYHVEDGIHLSDQAYEIIASELKKKLCSNKY
jgi:lysophospholipase L1-like esterase